MPIPRRTQWTDTMDINFVAATLDKYGLSDRFDAGEITQRSDSIDRTQRTSRVRRLNR